MKTGGSANEEFDSNGEINDNIVEELRSNVRILIQDKKFVEKIVHQAVKETGIEPNTVLRRAYDGNTEASWLVEKMIGEFLTDGEIKR